MLKISENSLIAFLMIFNDFWKHEKDEFGGRFINIGLENDAVAATHVVEGPHGPTVGALNAESPKRTFSNNSKK